MARSRIDVANGNDERTFTGGAVTIGGRSGVDVLIRDVMVADRHCEIAYEGGFVVRDLGSVVGTWVDGERARPMAELRDGSTIIVGTTRVTAAIDQQDGVAVLQLTTAPQTFWWRKPGKGVFGNDPDQLVHSETRFGRFPALRLGNRLAVLLGLVVLVAATFVATVMDTLADPGPLLPAHALVAAAEVGDREVHAGIEPCVQLAGEQGCAVCHAVGGGAIESKCRQCHGLPGEMAAEGSLRHPYHKAQVSDQQLCVRCHTDHTGTADLKPKAMELLGKCEECHQEDRTQLVARAPLDVPAQRPREYEALRFPHGSHAEVDCKICHRIDERVREDRQRGVPDDPMRHDFATVPYEICATCHVPGAELVGMTLAQREQWQPTETARWVVRWHGTDDEGRKCAQCHTSSTRDDGALAFGPDMKTVARDTFSLSQYADQRARFTRPSRSHAEQFAKHSQNKACSECHLDGNIETPAIAADQARTFWHGLHVRQGFLEPGANGAAVSGNAEEGCVSCHGALAGPDGATLATGSYQWPADAAGQKVCTDECHRDGDRALLLQPVAIAATERRMATAFPHDVHLNSDSYGNDGTLADGCFACHEFRSDDDTMFRMMPRTLPGAQDCSKCHAGHADVGGGACRQCHPSEAGTSNSFLVQAGIKDPPWPTRDWPAANGFSHLSAGHRDRDCASCHGDRLTEAGSLADVTAPDESASLCRDCHLEKQFHWR